MASYITVLPEEATALALPGLLVEEEVLLAAREAVGGQAQAAAAADAVIFDDGPQEPQEAASEPLDVEVAAGVARKPRRARRPTGGDDAGQFIPDDPATLDVNEAYEQADA